MTNAEQLVRQVAREAEATADTPMPAIATPTRPNKSVVVAVRLSPEDVASIEALASSLGVTTSTLIRGWIMEGLASRDDTTLVGAIDRLAADVQRLREVVA